MTQGNESLLSDRNEIVLIGTQPEDRAVEKQADELLDGITVALQDFDTETLLAIAEWRDKISPGGWMQNLIRQYVEVWR